MKTRAEEARKQFNIPVISSARFQYANPHLTRGVNFNNLVAVSKTKPSHQNRASVHFVPRVMLANTMSLVPKLDEVQELLLRLNVQVGCIVESWLKQHINESRGSFLKKLWCCVGGEVVYNNLVLSTELIINVNWPPYRDSKS